MRSVRIRCGVLREQLTGYEGYVRNPARKDRIAHGFLEERAICMREPLQRRYTLTASSQHPGYRSRGVRSPDTNPVAKEVNIRCLGSGGSETFRWDSTQTVELVYSVAAADMRNDAVE